MDRVMKKEKKIYIFFYRLQKIDTHKPKIHNAVNLHQYRVSI